MVDCADIFLIILQIIAICVDCAGIAATIWLLVGIPVWFVWILSFYVIAFCFAQLFLEWVYPHKISVYFLYLGRFWGRGLLYTLTGIILVSIGNPNVNAGAALMCFIIGIIMFCVGLVFICISMFSCDSWHPVSICRRCGNENYAA